MPFPKPFAVIEYDPHHSFKRNEHRLDKKPPMKKFIDRLSSLECDINKMSDKLLFNSKKILIEGNQTETCITVNTNFFQFKKLLAVRDYLIWVLKILNNKNVNNNQQTELIENNLVNIRKKLSSIEFSLHNNISEYHQVSPLEPLFKRNKKKLNPFDPNNFGEVIQNGLLVVEEIFFVHNLLFPKERLVASIKSSAPSFSSYISLCLLIFSSNVTSFLHNSSTLNHFYERACLLLPEVYENPKLENLSALLFLIGMSFFLCDYQRLSKASVMIVRMACLLKIHEVDLRSVNDKTSIEEIKDLVIKRKLWELICNRIVSFEVFISTLPSFLGNIGHTESQLDLIQEFEKRIANYGSDISQNLELFSELDLWMGKIGFNVLNFANSKLVPGVTIETLPPEELRLPKPQFEEAQNVVDFYLNRYYQSQKCQFIQVSPDYINPTIPSIDLPVDYQSNFKFIKPISRILAIFNIQIYLIYPSAFIYPVPSCLSISELETLLNTAFNQTQLLFVICYLFFQTILVESQSPSQINAKKLERIKKFIEKYPEPQVQTELKQLNSFNLKIIQISDSSAYIYCFLNALSSPTFLLQYHPQSPYLVNLKNHIIILLEIISIFNNFECSQNRVDIHWAVASLKEHIHKFPISPDFNINWDFYLS